MADPVAALEKEEVIDDKKEKEEVKEEKPADASNTDVVKALNEVKDALTKPNQPAPTAAEIRAALKEKTGFSDAQLDVVEQMTRAAATSSSKRTAELEEKVAWNDFKDEIGGKIDPAIEKMMKEELKQYEVELRGDKVLLKKVYYLAKGIIAEKVEKAKKDDPNNNDKLNNDSKIEGRRIVNDSPGSATGLENNGKGNKSGAETLTDDEKTISRKMGISEADYAKSKESKIVGERKPAAVFRGAKE